MDPRQHAADRTPRSFDGRDGDRQNAGRGFNGGDLVGAEGGEGPCREGKNAAAAACQLQAIPRELGDLAPIDLDHVAPGLAQPSGNSCSFYGVGDVAEARHHEVGGDGEDNIRVVNRLPGLVNGVEDLGGIAHRLAPLIKDRLVGAARAGHVGDAMDMVEHQGACSLEVAPL